MMDKNTTQADSALWQRPTFWLVLILLVAMVARFAYLLEIEHNVDHAYSIGQALTTLGTGNLPLVGQDTSLQFPNGALLGYLYAPVLAIVPHILALYLIVISLNTLAVYFAYRATALLYTPQAGLWASALMAVNPWIIEYSRSTWTHAFMPFLLSVSAFLLWRIILGKTRHAGRDMVLLAIAVTIVTQVALLGYFLLPHVVLLMLRYWHRLPKRGLLIGVGIFAVFNALFAVGLVERLDAVSQQANQMLEAGASESATLRSEPFLHTARLVSGAEYEINRGLQAPIADAELRHQLSSISTNGIALLLVVGILWALWDLRHNDKRDASTLVLVWLGVPAFTMAYNSALIHPFYLLMGLPAGYVLVGRVLDGITLRGKHKLALGIVVLFVGAHGVLMLVNSGRYYQETAHIPGAHGLTALSLEYALPLGEAIEAHLPPDGVVFAPVEGWMMQSMAGTYFRTSQETRSPAYTRLPVQGGIYVTFHEGDIAPSIITTERVEQFDLPDDTHITLDRIAPDALAQHDIENSLQAMGEKWLDFLGYDWQEDDANITLRTYWRVQAGIEQDSALAPYTFAPFVHLVNDDDRLLQVVDGVGVRGITWHRGDVHVHEITFTLPNEDVNVMVGQYDGVQQEGLIFILEDGTYTPTILLRDSNP
jgi:hypothetical protein